MRSGTERKIRSMKKLITAVIAILTASFMTGCGKKPPAAPSGSAVSFRNGVEEADIWILPQTPEILKTTLWGTATVKKLREGAEADIRLEAPAEAGTYIFRAIGSGGMYYEANDIGITEGCVIGFRKDDGYTYVLEVAPPGGGEPEIYEVFAARL